MNPKLSLLGLLLAFALCSCSDPILVVTREDGDKLNAASEFAKEISEQHAIECNAYGKVDGPTRIEFNVTDPETDHKALVPKISKLQSVQDFEGELQLVFVFRGASTNSQAVTNLGKYDAKNGKLIAP